MDISQERAKELFDYHKDGYFIRKIKTSNFVKIGEIAGYRDSTSDSRTYFVVNANAKKHYLHRLIYIWHYGEIGKKFIDHIDGDPSNNRIENLRVVTNAENLKNQKLSRKNTSGTKGVTWNKQENKWQAQIMSNKKYKSLGKFVNIEDAIKARKEAEIKYFGEFQRKDAA